MQSHSESITAPVRAFCYENNVFMNDYCLAELCKISQLTVKYSKIAFVCACAIGVMWTF